MSGESSPILSGTIPVFETFMTSWEEIAEKHPGVRLSHIMLISSYIMLTSSLPLFLLLSRLVSKYYDLHMFRPIPSSTEWILHTVRLHFFLNACKKSKTASRTLKNQFLQDTYTSLLWDVYVVLLNQSASTTWTRSYRTYAQTHALSCLH